MVDRVPKRERLMNLVSVLLASREPVPFREIAGRVVGYDDDAGGEAMEKRFDRDKADLRRLGIPVEYVTGEMGGSAGYVIPRQAVFQQKVSFSPQEAMMLTIAGRVGAAATGGGALEDALKSALRKLAVDLVGPDPLEDLGEVTVLRARTGDPRALENVTRLAQAVTGNRRVEITYDGAGRGTQTQRRVDPYGLGVVRGAWYLVGYCHLRQDLRVFKVSRVVGRVKLLGAADSGPAFAVPLEFRIDDHIGEEAWDFGSGEPVSVRFRLAPGVAMETVLPRGQEVSRDGEGTVVEVEIRRPEALVPWVLSRGGEVVVLEPAEIREAVAEESRRLLAALTPGTPAQSEPDSVERPALAAGEESA